MAVVAAETQAQAWDAVRAIEVQYEKLPVVTNVDDALKPGAPAVHEGGNRFAAPNAYSRGDVAKGFAESDIVVEENYRTSCELHTPLETYGAAVKWDGDHLTVWESTQSPFPIQSGVATALNMPLSKVRVICRLHGRRLREQAGYQQIHGDRGAAGAPHRPPGEVLPQPGRELPVHGQPARLQPEG